MPASGEVSEPWGHRAFPSPSSVGSAHFPVLIQHKLHWVKEWATTAWLLAGDLWVCQWLLKKRGWPSQTGFPSPNIKMLIPFYWDYRWLFPTHPILNFLFLTWTVGTYINSFSLQNFGCPALSPFKSHPTSWLSLGRCFPSPSSFPAHLVPSKITLLHLQKQNKNKQENMFIMLERKGFMKKSFFVLCFVLLLGPP